MKCDNCKENDANFYFKAIINGKTAEYHLCGDCAQKAGFADAPYWQQQSPIEGYLAAPFGYTGDAFGGRMMFPGYRMMVPMPVPRFELLFREESEAEPKGAEEKIPEDAGTELREKRELISLRHQLQEAVRTEDFEKAIVLRDKLKGMEK